jgi:hypothetical protein
MDRWKNLEANNLQFGCRHVHSFDFLQSIQPANDLFPFQLQIGSFDAALARQSLNITSLRDWSEAFREKLLNLASEQLQRVKNRNYRTSRQANDHDQARAEVLIRRGLQELGLSEHDLKISQGSDPRANLTSQCDS